MGVLPGDLAALVLLALAAVVIGFSKTALGGLGVVSVAIFATVLPTRQSTAAILAVLLVGDVIACWHYRHDADWVLVRRLLPAVVPGLVLGTLFLKVASDDVLRRTIGGVMLVLLALQLWVKLRPRVEEGEAPHASRAWAAGSGMGFATMTANAAGPVMTLYLSAAGIDKRRFVGTSAWFFLIVNLCKVPFSVGLGLLHTDDALRAVALAPAVLVGALVGYAVVRRISQRTFDVAVLLASAVAATALLLG